MSRTPTLGSAPLIGSLVRGTLGKSVPTPGLVVAAADCRGPVREDWTAELRIDLRSAYRLAKGSLVPCFYLETSLVASSAAE